MGIGRTVHWTGRMLALLLVLLTAACVWEAGPVLSVRAQVGTTAENSAEPGKNGSEGQTMAEEKTFRGFPDAGQGTLRFRKNGEFRILVVTDTQDIDKPQEATLTMLDAELDAADADLVLLLGDQIHGPAIGHDEEKTRTALAAILDVIAQHHVPFAAVFGNHDDEGGVSKETQLGWYQSYPDCLMVKGSAGYGVGNYNLLVWSEDGTKPLANLWMIDSGTYCPKQDGTYDWVHGEQIQWYKETARRIADHNGGAMVPAYVFQHIIVPEIYDLLTVTDASAKGQPNVVRGFGTWDRNYYRMGEGFRAGNLRECPCPPDHNGGEFEAMKEMGDVRAMFFGHDHTNDFVGTYEGIDLVNTDGTGFFLYGPGGDHGGRLIVLHEDDPSHYETNMLYWKDIVEAPLPTDGSATNGAVYMFYTRRYLPLLLLAGAGVTFGTLAMRRRGRRKQEKGSENGK